MEIILGAFSLSILLFLLGTSSLWLAIVGCLMLTAIRVAVVDYKRSLVVFVFSIGALGNLDPAWLSFLSLVAFPYFEFLSASGRYFSSLLAAGFYLVWEIISLSNIQMQTLSVAEYALRDAALFAFAIAFGHIRNLWKERADLLVKIQNHKIEQLRSEFSYYLHQNVASSLVKIILLARSGQTENSIRREQIVSHAESSLSEIRTFIRSDDRISGEIFPRQIPDLLTIAKGCGWNVDLSIDNEFEDLIQNQSVNEIASELILNALKYGDNRSPLFLMLKQIERSCLISSRNEIASESNCHFASSGLGLREISRCIDRLGGDLRFSSENGYWWVECRIPISD